MHNNMENKTTTTVNGSELTITRLLNAPQELVFEAWTKAEHLEKWWGPDGFSTTTHEIDVRPGGIWRFIMHGPDGTDFPNKIQFTEVVKPSRLSYKHDDDGAPTDIRFRVTVTFEQVGDQTLVTQCSVFETAEALQRVEREFKAIEGGVQHLGRLAAFVEIP